MAFSVKDFSAKIPLTDNFLFCIFHPPQSEFLSNLIKHSYYKVPKAEVTEKVSIIISTPNVHLVDKTIIAVSLVLYSQKNINFIDAYNAPYMKFHGLGTIYSYDEDFDAIDGIEREEP